MLRFVVITFLWSCAVALTSSAALADELQPHKWRWIHYDDLPCPWGTRLSAEPYLTHDKYHQGLVFCLALAFPGLDDDTVVDEPGPGDIVVRLHVGDEVIEPKKGDGLCVPAAGNSLGTTSTFEFVFDWQKNVLNNAFLEVRFLDKTHWLFIPYGFVQDPAGPLAPDLEGKSPGLPPAIRALPKPTRIEQWRLIEYDEVSLGSGVAGTIRVSYGPELQWSLYIDWDSELAGTWDLYEPRSKLGFLVGQREVSLSCRSVSFEYSGERKDSYDVYLYHFPALYSYRRGWGELLIEVGGRKSRITVPSSLYYVYHARYYHEG